jgi:hypothetical protein
MNVEFGIDPDPVLPLCAATLSVEIVPVDVVEF